MVLCQLKENNGDFCLIISDNGVGLPNNFEEHKGSLGMNLIGTLTNKLDGEYTFNSTDEGTMFTIEFAHPGNFKANFGFWNYYYLLWYSFLSCRLQPQCFL